MSIEMQTRKSTLPTHVFREYDIRGVAWTELDEHLAHLLGRAFARRVLREG